MECPDCSARQTTFLGVLIRHVEARTIRSIRDELAVLAFATRHSGRQGINSVIPIMVATKLSDPTDPRELISDVLPIGALHQHLRSQVNHGKAFILR